MEAWGKNLYGQCEVHEPNSEFFSVEGGYRTGMGLRMSSTTGIEDHDPWDMPGAGGISILSLAPNPFNPVTRITFETLIPGRLAMSIYDVAGRRINSINLGRFGPGTHRTAWDGRDAAGRNVSSGVYFIRILGNGTESSPVKAVLVR